MAAPEFRHTPVLLAEALAYLRVRPGGCYIDCTLGQGGHAQAILAAASPGGKLLGLDVDAEAVAEASRRLIGYGPAALLARGNYRNLAGLSRSLGYGPVDGILFDLGLSSPQVEAPERGFSFLREGPLDMRFDPAQALTAANIVNHYSQAELARLLEAYGEEPRARSIARSIVRQRPLRTTLELARAVGTAIGRRGRLHPATRTFQALRLAVNQELENLDLALAQAPDLLKPGGRLAVVAYHSLEDRLVKHFLRQCPALKTLTKKVIRPTPEEVRGNPRSRSARLRAAERI